MGLNEKDKELLIRALTYYYENHVWNDMVKKDNNKASEEDYAIRRLTDKLGIRDMFPMQISSRW